MKHTRKGNFFSLPNEVFLLGLSPSELAVYSYLRRCENRKTHQCWPSYKTIGKAVGMSENTVTQVHAPPQNLRRKTKKESPPAIDNFLKIVVSWGWLFRRSYGIVCR